jgi:hypothetical protein
MRKDQRLLRNITVITWIISMTSLSKKRAKIRKQLEHLRSSDPPGKGPFPNSEQMQREDRER